MSDEMKNRKALGDAMVAWRHALGLEVVDALAIAKSGIKAATWSKLENGHDDAGSEKSCAAVDRVFGWPIGTAWAVRMGEREAPAPPVPQPRLASDDVVKRLLAVEEAVRRLGDQGARIEAGLAGIQRLLPATRVEPQHPEH